MLSHLIDGYRDSDTVHALLSLLSVSRREQVKVAQTAPFGIPPLL